jgi:hypothetical protein
VRLTIWNNNELRCIGPNFGARRARSGTVDSWSTGAAVEGSAVAVFLFLTPQLAKYQVQHANGARLVQGVVTVAALR